MDPELLNLCTCERETKRLSGGLKELAQLTLLFHVEQIRETQNNVKLLVVDAGTFKESRGRLTAPCIFLKPR